MFSTPVRATRNPSVESDDLVHTACGGESSMNTGGFETYSQSTATTTTTTLLYL